MDDGPNPDRGCALCAADGGEPVVRDVGAAIVNAQWSFLRDRFDVNALVAHISETAQRSDFVSKLHAAADKARHQQIPRGRPKTRRPNHPEGGSRKGQSDGAADSLAQLLARNPIGFRRHCGETAQK